MTKISEMSFEKRIRIKYFYFGFLLGITVFCTIMFTSGITAYILRTSIIAIEKNTEQVIIGQITMFGIFMMFIPLLIWLWYSKSKMKNHPELEPIGLKWDYEKVV